MAQPTYNSELPTPAVQIRGSEVNPSKVGDHLAMGTNVRQESNKDGNPTPINKDMEVGILKVWAEMTDGHTPDPKRIMRVRFQELMDEIEAVNLSHERHVYHILRLATQFDRQRQEKIIRELKPGWLTLGTLRAELKYVQDYPFGSDSEYTTKELIAIIREHLKKTSLPQKIKAVHPHE